MAGALAERYGVAAPLTEEEQRQLHVVERSGRHARRSRLMSRPAVLLVLFAICLALLGVARVTLTFAVVQKSLDTEQLVAQQRALTQENAKLSERLARLTAATRVHNLAISKLGLVAAPNVVYLPQGDAAGSSSADGSSTDATTTADVTGSQTATTTTP